MLKWILRISEEKEQRRMARKKNPEEFEDDDGDFGEEPNFDDPDDFVDDITDEVEFDYVFVP